MIFFITEAAMANGRATSTEDEDKDIWDGDTVPPDTEDKDIWED